MISVRFLLAVSIIFMLFACQEQQIGTPVTDNSALVGKWESYSSIFEVFKDGKIVSTDKLKLEPTTGTYEFVDKTIFRVNLGHIGTHDYKAYIYEEKLFLTSLDGRSNIAYKRIKEQSK